MSKRIGPKMQMAAGLITATQRDWRYELHVNEEQS